MANRRMQERLNARLAANMELDLPSRKSDRLKQELLATKAELAKIKDMERFDDDDAELPKGTLPFVSFTYKKELPAQVDKLTRENKELQAQLDSKKKEFNDLQRQLYELRDMSSTSSRRATTFETHLDEKTKLLELSNKERDKLERELASTKADMASIKRTLELERQERRELEAKALELIKGAKRKWETAEKEKIAQLNKHIEVQTTRITELCTSNNEMSSRIQRTECELETANAELHKLRVFQAQYKESLQKTRELNRQSVQGVENKLEEMANRAHTQLADLRTKLEMETARNVELETKLRNEQESNHCRESRLNLALEMAQRDLREYQEEVRRLKESIPPRDQEIESLRNQIKEKSKELEEANAAEQILTAMQEQIDTLTLENSQLKEQLEATKSDLSETIMVLEQNESKAKSFTQDKKTLQQRLRESLHKEEEHLRKVGNLEELLKRLEESVTKLETENASLKKGESSRKSAATRSSLLLTNSQAGEKVIVLEEQIKKLEEQLQAARENAATERQNAKQAQLALWKKDKEVSDANLDKRIAVREAKTAEDKIKNLQEEKQRLSSLLSNRVKEEEEKSKKLLKELDTAKSSLEQVTRESSRNKTQADSAQRALIQANKQIEELQSSNGSMRRELDSTRKELRTAQNRIDTLNAENKRMSLSMSKHNEGKTDLETKLESLQQEINGYKVNVELLKETCTVLEEQLTDYEKLTSDHETRENLLIQNKMRMQKDLETAEAKLREVKLERDEEKRKRIQAEKAIEKLESETSDIEDQKSAVETQRNEYKKRVQELNKEVQLLTARCGNLMCDLSETQRALEDARADARVVKEESSQHLTMLHEMKETNYSLMTDLQASVDQGQDLRARIVELEGVLEDMRQFYKEREIKAESTRQQHTKLITYLQTKLEEANKKKKRVCDNLFGIKHKENMPPSGMGMPVGYRELENQLASERAKVKVLTEQLFQLKTQQAASPLPQTPTSPETKKAMQQMTESSAEAFARCPSLRAKLNTPHRFNIELPMRAGRCAGCFDSVTCGKLAAICAECQLMAHTKCSASIPATCGLPGDFGKQFAKTSHDDESFGSSVPTLTLEDINKPERDVPDSNKMDTLNLDGLSSVFTGSSTDLDNGVNDDEDDSSSEFSFTSSLMEELDGQGRKVHFESAKFSFKH